MLSHSTDLLISSMRPPDLRFLTAFGKLSARIGTRNRGVVTQQKAVFRIIIMEMKQTLSLGRW